MEKEKEGSRKDGDVSISSCGSKDGERKDLVGSRDGELMSHCHARI